MTWSCLSLKPKETRDLQEETIQLLGDDLTLAPSPHLSLCAPKGPKGRHALLRSRTPLKAKMSIRNLGFSNLGLVGSESSAGEKALSSGECPFPGPPAKAVQNKRLANNSLRIWPARGSFMPLNNTTKVAWQRFSRCASLQNEMQRLKRPIQIVPEIKIPRVRAIAHRK